MHVKVQVWMQKWMPERGGSMTDAGKEAGWEERGLGNEAGMEVGTGGRKRCFVILKRWSNRSVCKH